MAAMSPTTRVTLALEAPIDKGGVALDLYTKAMNLLSSEDRNRGGREILFLQPTASCFEPLRVQARKHRVARMAEEVIAGSLDAYKSIRRKTGNPLRFRHHRDSMPMMVESQRKAAMGALKAKGYTNVQGLSMAHDGTALTFLHEAQDVVQDVDGPQDDRDLTLALLATPAGLQFALEDGTGQTATYLATRKTLLDPKFVQRLVRQIARSVRALIVHVDSKLNGLPAEILRQVYRRVRRQKAESATALKKVGSVDRSTLLCPSCHRLVRHAGVECACGATHSQGVLDAYVILAAGRDAMGSIACLKQGKTPLHDVLAEGAPFKAAGNKEDDDNANAQTGRTSSFPNSGVCRDRMPLNGAVMTVGQGAHTEHQPQAPEPVGGSPSKGSPRPVTSTDYSNPGSQEPDPRSPVEARFDHPLLSPWWKRIGEPSKPKVIEKEDIHTLIQDAASAAREEARFYVEKHRVHCIPDGCGLNLSSTPSEALKELSLWLFRHILHQAISDFPALEAEIQLG
jgi:hypothetical protein